MEWMEILQKMLNDAKEHNLEMECLATLIVRISDDDYTSEDLERDCSIALGDWDI